MSLLNFESYCVIPYVGVTSQIALLKDNPRAVTITAVTETKCAVIGRKAFDRMLGPLEDILKRNMGLYEQFSKE